MNFSIPLSIKINFLGYVESGSSLTFMPVFGANQICICMSEINGRKTYIYRGGMEVIAFLPMPSYIFLFSPSGCEPPAVSGF